MEWSQNAEKNKILAYTFVYVNFLLYFCGLKCEGIKMTISQEIVDLLSKLSCEKVAQKLGIDVQRHKALCFMHDDHNPSMTFFGHDKSRWKCFACDKGGNAILLVQEYYHCSFVEACVWLGQNFGIYIDQQPTSKRRVVPIRKLHKESEEDRKFSSEIAQTIIDESVLTISGKQFLINERQYRSNVINQLRIVSIEKSDDIIKKLQAEYDDEGLLESGFCKRTNGRIYLSFFTPCLVYPYYDEQNSIVGIQSRYLGKKEGAPRFQFVSGQKTRVFNLPIINRMQAGDDLYISEGVTDCLALLSSGKNAVAIPSATILPKDDLYKLRYFRLHMYPDCDEAGKRAYEALQEFFINHYTTIKREVLPEGVKDYSDYYQLLNR